MRASFIQRVLFRISSMFRPHQRGPVKRLFSLGILALVGSGTLALVQLSSTSENIAFMKAPPVVIVGESFTLDIFLDVAEEVNAVDLTISYPDDRLAITNLRDGQSVLNIWTEDPVAKGGQIVLRGGTFRRGFIGEHRIISVRAVPTRPGHITLQPEELTLLIGDGTGREVAARTITLDPLRIRAISPEQAKAEGVTGADQRETQLRADLTGDGRVTMTDISMFLAAWGNRDVIYDFTGDGQMTFRDFSIVLAEFFLFR